MKELFKNRTLGFYLGLAGGFIALVTSIIYLVYALRVGLFVAWIFVFLLLGALSSLIVVFKDFSFAPLIPAIFYGLALGIHANDRVLMVAYMAKGVYGMGETGAILSVVITIFVLTFISIILACVSCFFNQRKKENAA